MSKQHLHRAENLHKILNNIMSKQHLHEAEKLHKILNNIMHSAMGEPSQQITL